LNRAKERSLFGKKLFGLLNIILDFFLEREPFFQDASMLFEAIASSQLEGFITASSATDIFYICRKQTQNLEEARQILTITLATLSVGSVDRAILETALELSRV
jgi:predicted nucleic acid-binding protein